jgi:hypothetical protein
MILEGDSEAYIRLEIGPNIAHAFKSLSHQAALLNYSTTEWSPDDTFKLILME